MKKPTLFIFCIISVFFISCNSTSKDKSDTNVINKTEEKSENEQESISKANYTQQFLMQKQQKGIDFYAIGNEPSWTLELDFEGVFSFKTMNGIEMNVPAVKPTLAQDHNVKRYRAVNDNEEIIIQLIQGECNDTMSDKTYSYSVNIDYKISSDTDYKSFTGCGNFIPDFRLHDIWAIEKVNNIKIDAQDFEKGAPQLELFVSDKRVLGNDGCNTFRGSFYNENNRIYFGSLAGTRMACPPSISKVSNAIINVLGKKMLTYKIENNHLTILENTDEVLVLKHID